MKRRLTCLVGLTAFAIACGAYLVLAEPPTYVIHQNVTCPTVNHTQAKGLQVIGTHRWAKGVVVLYSALCPTKDAKAPLQRVLGHQVVKRDGMNWQVSSSDSYGTGANPGAGQKLAAQKPSERLIDYGVSYSDLNVKRSQWQGHGIVDRGAGDRYTILYGQILTPKVAAIEATFNTGQVLRDDGNSGTFALVATGATRVCELRILGADNQLLRREELSPPAGLWKSRPLVSRTQTSARCLPLSSQ